MDYRNSRQYRLVTLYLIRPPESVNVTRLNVHAQIYYACRVFPRAVIATAFIGVWLGFLFTLALVRFGVI